MKSICLLPLYCALLSMTAVAQSGRATLLTAPVVLGQTAGFALGHPPAIAGNLYALLLSSPSWPQAVPATVPGVVVNGLLRIDVNGLLVGAVGVLGASGRTATVPMPVPNNSLLVGFSFDVQGVDIDAAGACMLADNDLELVVAAPPPASANMVAIAAGTFQMGSPEPLGQPPYFNQAHSQPVHPVTITRPFWMGKFEVTQAAYQAVMGSNPAFFVGANRPVEVVSWSNAMAYCNALTALEAAAGRLPSGYLYRLPTEAEWEYCCRAGTTTEFDVGGSLSCGQANFTNGSVFCVPHSSTGGQTIAVGSYAANAWGLNDMKGNVWEWCLDSWDGSANYPAGPVSDPYVTSGATRVMRGGGWNGDSTGCRSATRTSFIPALSLNFIGFRVVCAPVLP